MRLSLALPVGARDVTHAARRVNTHAHLTARAATSPLGALTLPGRPACGGRLCKGRGRFPPIIGRQRRVGPHDPDQRLIVLRATGIGFQPPHQRQGFFRTEIDLVKVLEKFEASKHDGFHLNGAQASGVGMRGLLYRNRAEKSSPPVGRAGAPQPRFRGVQVLLMAGKAFPRNHFLHLAQVLQGLGF